MYFIVNVALQKTTTPHQFLSFFFFFCNDYFVMKQTNLILQPQLGYVNNPESIQVIKQVLTST